MLDLHVHRLVPNVLEAWCFNPIVRQVADEPSDARDLLVPGHPPPLLPNVLLHLRALSQKALDKVGALVLSRLDLKLDEKLALEGERLGVVAGGEDALLGEHVVPRVLHLVNAPLEDVAPEDLVHLPRLLGVVEDFQERPAVGAVC